MANLDRLIMAENSRNLKIGIVGLGMVGEQHRRWFAQRKGFKRGETLFCLDNDKAKNYDDDINQADIVWVSVPTPSDKSGRCDTSIVESVVSNIQDGKIIVINSTMIPGTTEYLQSEYPGKRFLFNPEFLTESQAWEDFINPIRQIVGFTDLSKGDSMRVLNLLPIAKYMSPWSVSTYKFTGHTATEAEVIKYYSNVFGAIKVTLANIFADNCLALKKLGYDVSYENVRDAVGADPRIGQAWLDVTHGSYRGFGGYCFPKDLLAYIRSIETLKKETPDQITQLFSRSVDALQAIWNYNIQLLNLQNLTIDDVSAHNKDIILRKKKDIS